MRRGFTVIELLVVVAILGMLASVVVVHMSQNVDDAERGVVKTDMSGLQQAIKLYRLDHGRYPRETGDLYGGEKSYLENPPPLDPWGYEYLLEQRDGRVVIVTYGADAAPGGDGLDADLDSLTLLQRERRG